MDMACAWGLRCPNFPGVRVCENVIQSWCDADVGWNGDGGGGVHDLVWKLLSSGNTMRPKCKPTTNIYTCMHPLIHMHKVIRHISSHTHTPSWPHTRTQRCSVSHTCTRMRPRQSCTGNAYVGVVYFPICATAFFARSLCKSLAMTR